ncbi:MAG: hypothetical protein SNH63_00360 [Rikenellaceae bacterium]
MKRKLYTLLLACTIILLAACTTAQKGEWSKQERKTMRRALHEYREMVYLAELSDAQFFIFGDQLMDAVEMTYPDFSDVIEFPYLDDTIRAYITTTILEQLDADGANMRYIYPYRTLRKEGRLPEGLTRSEQRTFYKCLARKINAEYSTFESFFWAVAADTTNMSKIATFQSACAKSLFDWPNNK